MALAPMALQAANLVTPDPTQVHEVTKIHEVVLYFDTEIWNDPEDKAVLMDADRNTLEEAWIMFDNIDYTALDITFSGTYTDPGDYYLLIPAGSADGSPEYTIHYRIAGGGQTVPCSITSITPDPSETITQGDYSQFNQIRLDFSNDDYISAVNENLIKLTNAAGTEIPYTVGGFYTQNQCSTFGCSPFVRLEFNADTLLPSGTYTLTLGAGAFTSPAGSSETASYSWDYVRTAPDADPTPIQMTTAELGKAKYEGYVYWPVAGPVYSWVDGSGVAMTDGMKVAELKGDYMEGTETYASAFLFGFNHADKTKYLAWELTDLSTNEILHLGGTANKTDDNKFIIAWAQDQKLIKGTNYKLELHAYSSDNSQTRVEFGQGYIYTLAGDGEAFLYSPAELVAISPEPSQPELGEYSTIDNLDDNKITLVFSGKVKVTDRTSMNYGMGVSVPAQYESKNGQEYDYVWYVYIDQSMMADRVSIDMAVYAEDEEGLPVRGNSGFEASSNNMFSYDLTICQPRIVLDKTDSHVPEIGIINVTASNNGAINGSWMAYPYVVDAEGNRVAELDQEYAEVEEFGYTWTEPYKIVRTSGGSEPDPLELQMSFIPAVTTPGTYTIKFPQHVFAFGTQFEGTSSIAQDFVFHVAPFYTLDYATDSHSVALQQVEEGKTATVSLTPAEGWKLDRLTFNGDDVTDQVADNAYTTPAMTANSTIYAAYAFDGAVAEPNGADQVVTDLDLRAWSDAGKVYVAGMKEGQTLRVYTAGGALLTTMAAESDCTAEVSAPAGVLVLTVSDANHTVAIKLVNK